MPTPPLPDALAVPTDRTAGYGGFANPKSDDDATAARTANPVLHGIQKEGSDETAPQNSREDPEVERFIGDTPLTDNFWQDFDPTKQSYEFYLSCFAKGDAKASVTNTQIPRSGLGFLGPAHLRVEFKVHFYCKYDPKKQLDR